MKRTSKAFVAANRIVIEPMKFVQFEDGHYNFDLLISVTEEEPEGGPTLPPEPNELVLTFAGGVVLRRSLEERERILSLIRDNQ
jgi:hypothetical protein